MTVREPGPADAEALAALLNAQSLALYGTADLSAESMRFLAASGTIKPEQLASVPLSTAASRQLETAHRRLINLHLEKELKSARVLREMRQAP